MPAQVTIPDSVAVTGPYPGFDAKRKMAGALFPGHVFTGHFDGIKYDSELTVSW